MRSAAGELSFSRSRLTAFGDIPLPQDSGQATSAFSQKVRFVSKFDGPLQVIGGVYYEQVDQSRHADTYFGYGDQSQNPFGNPAFVGPRHAEIGLDYVMDATGMAKYLRANAALYGGGGQYPDDGRIDFAPPSAIPEIANELLRRGYAEEEVKGVLGENYLRVLDANQPAPMCASAPGAQSCKP